MSEKKKSAEAPSLREERDKFVAFSFAGAHLLVEVTSAGKVVFSSGASCGLCKNGAEKLIGKSFKNMVIKDDHGYVGELFGRLKKSGRIEQARLRMLSHGNKTIYALMGGISLPSKPGHHFLSLSMPPQLQHKEKGDDSSGLLDNETFTATATERMQAASRMNFDHNLTFFMLDGLAELSKQAEPEKIEEVMSELSAVLRASSIGGDSAGILEEGKFGLVHDSDVDSEEVRKRIEKILQSHMEKPEKGKKGKKESKTKSFTLDFEMGDLSEMDATKALVYSIRKFSDEEANDFDIDSLSSGAKVLLEETSKRVEKVRATIAERDFDLVFQPIVGIDGEKVHHFEALTRLVGVASPQDFITFTEQVGLIEDFDLTVAQMVLEDLENHAKIGWHPCIALNLSARSLASDIFVDQLIETVRTLGEKADQLMFEVTETHAITDMERMNGVLQKFRDMGHTIALDDMGSGTTTLSTLRELQVDYAKLDGQLIRDAAADERTMALMRSIVNLSKGLDIKIIAEQIETEEQARMISKLGVEFGQGYLYGRPARDFRDRYANTKKHDTKRRGIRADWG